MVTFKINVPKSTINDIISIIHPVWQGKFMNKLIWLLSWRYIKGIRTEKNISVMLITCFIAIFIGAFALALVASVMNGFERATCQKLRSIHADVIVRAPSGHSFNFDKMQKQIFNNVPGIKAASPSSYKQVILQKESSESISNAVFLKAINPGLEKNTTTLERHLLDSSVSLETVLKNNQIIIGKTLAHDLDIKIGDSLNLLFISDKNIANHRVHLSHHPTTVSAIFSTGIEEFDAGIVYGSFNLLHELYPGHGIEQINIRLDNNSQEISVINTLKKEYRLEAHSWKDFYKPLVHALKLEKYAMILILVLIALVAIMNIISVIFMQIIKKRSDIALLLSMGMHHRSIVILFIYIGMGVASIACLCGLSAAYGVGLLLEKYPFIPLPDTYYTEYLPIYMEWRIFMGVFMLILLFSLLASYIPASNIKSLQAARILRFEG